MNDQDPFPCPVTLVYVPAATLACPLVLFCPWTCRGVASLGLLVTENAPVAHPLHDHRSTDALATWIVPRLCVPFPVKVCVVPFADEDVEVLDEDGDELTVTVVVLVMVCVAMRVTTCVFAGAVTVRVGAVTVFTRVTTRAGA